MIISIPEGENCTPIPNWVHGRSAPYIFLGTELIYHLCVHPLLEHNPRIGISVNFCLAHCLVYNKKEEFYVLLFSIYNMYYICRDQHTHKPCHTY